MKRNPLGGIDLEKVQAECRAAELARAKQWKTPKVYRRCMDCLQRLSGKARGERCPACQRGAMRSRSIHVRYAIDPGSQMWLARVVEMPVLAVQGATEDECRSAIFAAIKVHGVDEDTNVIEIVPLGLRTAAQ